LIPFCSKPISYVYTNNYSIIERIDKITAKIIWCSFLPYNVVATLKQLTYKSTCINILLQSNIAKL